MYRFVAGIDLDPEVPGYKKLVIRPYPSKELKYARAEYYSINGKIASGWHRNGRSFELNVTIPTNTIATVYVPTNDETQITETDRPANNSNGVTFLNSEKGYSVFAVESGTYRFTSTFSY